MKMFKRFFAGVLCSLILVQSVPVYMINAGAAGTDCAARIEISYKDGLYDWENRNVTDGGLGGCFELQYTPADAPAVSVSTQQKEKKALKRPKPDVTAAAAVEENTVAAEEKTEVAEENTAATEEKTEENTAATENPTEEQVSENTETQQIEPIRTAEYASEIKVILKKAEKVYARQIIAADQQEIACSYTYGETEDTVVFGKPDGSGSLVIEIRKDEEAPEGNIPDGYTTPEGNFYLYTKNVEEESGPAEYAEAGMIASDAGSGVQKIEYTASEESEYKPENIIGTLTAGADGSWNYKEKISDAVEGTSIYRYFWLTDYCGNRRQISVEFRIDHTGPEITEWKINGIGTLSEDDQVYWGNVSDDPSVSFYISEQNLPVKMECKLFDGDATVWAAETTNCTQTDSAQRIALNADVIRKLDSGTYRLQLILTDEAGNTTEQVENFNIRKRKITLRYSGDANDRIPEAAYQIGDNATEYPFTKIQTNGVAEAEQNFAGMTGKVGISVKKIPGISVTGVTIQQSDGVKDVTKNYDGNVLTLDVQTLSAADTVITFHTGVIWEFEIACQNGTFIPTEDTVFDASVGKVEFSAGNKDMSVTGVGKTYARQILKEGQPAVPYRMERSDHAAKTVFSCENSPESQIMTVEMAEDHGMPQGEILNDTAYPLENGEYIYYISSRNYSLKVNAADKESGIWKVEFAREPEEYEKAITYELEQDDADNSIWINKDTIGAEQSVIYLWLTDYCDNHTMIPVTIRLDDDPPSVDKSTITALGTCMDQNGRHYWASSDSYGLKFKAEDQSTPITAEYQLYRINGKTAGAVGEKQTATLSEPDENGLCTLTLPYELINGLDDGTYRIAAQFSDMAFNTTELDEDFYQFTVDNTPAEINAAVQTAECFMKPAEDPEQTEKIEAVIKSQSTLKYLYYAVTCESGGSEPENLKEPAETDWIRVPEDQITIHGTIEDGEWSEANVTYELPVGKAAQGTNRYYLWTRGLSSKSKTVRAMPVIRHIDGNAPVMDQYTVERTTSAARRAFQFVFGTFIRKEEELTFCLRVRDLYEASDYAKAPEVTDVKLYYMTEDCSIADDAETVKTEGTEVPSDRSIGQRYEELEKSALKAQQVERVKGTDTYRCSLKVEKNNRFYKLYFVAQDKAGNKRILNAASLSGGKDSPVVMVDSRKPQIANTLKVSCEKPDYKEERDGKTLRWYRGDRDIAYDLHVTDQESGIFSVDVSVNEKSLGADADGNKFYDAGTASDLSSLALEREFSYVYHPDQGSIQADGSYHMEILAEDNAGNISKTSDTIYVDHDAPKITEMEFDNGQKDELTTVPTQYGYFFQKAVTATVYATDFIGDGKETGSGVAVIYYRLMPADGKEETNGMIRASAAENGIYTAQFTIPEGFKGQLEVTAEDHVGQTGRPYQPKGAVVETAKEHESTSSAEITLPDTPYKDVEGNPLYANDISIRLAASDSRSGLKQSAWSVKEYYAAGSFMEGTVDISSVYQEDSGEWVSTLSGEEDWTVSKKPDVNLVTQTEKSVTVDSDTNHMEAKLHITDNAENTSEAAVKTFSIDKTAPKIEVVYDNNQAQQEKYYKEQRTATITVTDANFSADACSIEVTGPQVQISEWKHQAADGCDGTVHTAECRHSCQVVFSEDGDYTFTVSCQDLAGNKASYGKTDEFTIDKTKPVIRVAYDNNSAVNGSYYKESRTAEIEVEDQNFDPDNTQVEVTRRYEGVDGAAPAATAFTRDGDVWRASVHFIEDGDYSIRVTATDLAGNEGEEYAKEEFTIDQTAPEITIGGVEDHSANKGKVAPVIQCSDINLNAPEVAIKLEGVNRGQVMYEGNRVQTAGSIEVQMNDFAHTEDVDDLYTLTVTAVDRAGNETVEQRTFSVNRFGSVYILSDGTKDLVDSFYTNKEREIVITEVNVDTLQYGEVNCSLDGTSTKMNRGTEYEVKSKTDDGSWKMYEYHIFAQNFEKEGKYVVSLYSEDQAENKSSNQAKGKEIAFVMDKTAPSIVIGGVENGGQYVDAIRNITADVQDNILLDSVDVYANGQKQKSAGREELLVSNGQVELSVRGSNHSQMLYVEARDAAGNVARSQDIRFLITKNLLIQWVNNVPLCAGSVTATAGVAAGAVLLRRRHINLLKLLLKKR